MRTQKNAIIAFSIFVIISLTVTSLYSVGNPAHESFNNFAPPDSLNTSRSENPSYRVETLTNYTYGFNASAKIERVITFEQYGVLSLNDTLEIRNIGNETMTVLNYTLPNINTKNIVFLTFRVANESKLLDYSNTTVLYRFSKNLNYTTFRVPFNVNNTSLQDNETIYIRAYAEFTAPYTASIVNNEQLLHYKEMLYPLINNIPIINGTTTIKTIAAGDTLVDNQNYPVTPKKYITVNASAGYLEWQNYTREPFNYTQNYEDDLIINAYVTSVSTGVQAGEQFKPSTMIFETTEAYRRVEVSMYGHVIITERQTMRFNGPERPAVGDLTKIYAFSLVGFTIILPQNVTVLDLRDEVGKMNQRYQLDSDAIYDPGNYNLRETVDGQSALAIYPRYQLYNGEELTFEIKYKVPLGDMLKKVKNTNNHTLELTPFSGFNWTMNKLTLEVVLPKGSVFKYSNYTSEDSYQEFILDYYHEWNLRKFGWDRIVKFEATDFSGSDNSAFSINFNYSYFHLVLTYVFYVLLIGTFSLAYIAIRKVSMKAKEVTGTVETEDIPVEKIKTFVTQYEEKITTQTRILSTRQKMAQKKIRAKEGQDLVKTLENRLRKVEETLSVAKAELSAISFKYKELVQSIEINERKLHEEQRNLVQLRNEYRTKKTLTKESYVKLTQERSARIEKLRNDIDSKLINLRLLIED